MSLRPRYSLLTLLVLTALVAGGVKLWYGPHHVVEKTSTEEEVEFTYTRDWRGSRIIQGPWVLRKLQPSGILESVEVRHYRQGSLMDWVIFYYQDSLPKSTAASVKELYDLGDMTDHEMEECCRVLDQEQQRFIEQGRKFDAHWMHLE